MSVINTNLKALFAVGANTGVQSELSKVTQQLATGRRVNSAADDPAALVSGTLLNTSYRGKQREIANINDGISLMQTADSGLSSIASLLFRAKELAVQAASDTLSDADRGTIDREFQEVKQSIDGVANATTFNNILVLRGELIDIEHTNDSVISGQVTLTDTPVNGTYTLFVNATPVAVDMVQGESTSSRLSKVESAINALSDTHGVRAVIQGDALSLVGNPSTVSAWYNSDVPGLSAASFGLQVNTVTRSNSIAFTEVDAYTPDFIETDTYIEWRDGGTSGETMWLEPAASASTVAGELSLVDDTLYRGDGSVAVAVGRVDATLNGQSGQPLRIWRELGGFLNGNFNAGVRGSADIAGWTVSDRQVFLDGVDAIAGLPTAIDQTRAPDGGRELTADQPIYASYSSQLTSGGQFSGDLSVQMYSSMVGVDNYPTGKGGVVHGPAIASNQAVELAAGDTVSFDWRAQGGADAFDVYAYIVDETTGRYEVLLDETGATSNASTPWATVTHTVERVGSYKFVFVSGTWDATTGQAAGAQLYIDNVSTSVDVKPETALSSEDIDALKAGIQYSNENPYTASLTVNGEVFSAQTADGKGALITALADNIQAKIDDGTLGQVRVEVLGEQLRVYSETPGKAVDVKNVVSSVNVAIDVTPSASGELEEEDVWGLAGGNANSTAYKTADAGSYFTYGTGPQQLNFDVTGDSAGAFDIDNLSADGELLGAITGDLVDPDKNINISTTAAAGTMIGLIDEAINGVSGAQAKVGAMISRLTFSAEQLATGQQHLAQARSKILDADYAQATTEMVRLQIINDASTQLIAKSAQLQQMVLQLVNSTPRSRS